MFYDDYIGDASGMNPLRSKSPMYERDCFLGGGPPRPIAGECRYFHVEGKTFMSALQGSHHSTWDFRKRFVRPRPDETWPR